MHAYTETHTRMHVYTDIHTHACVQEEEEHISKRKSRSTGCARTVRSEPQGSDVALTQDVHVCTRGVLR